MNGSQIKYMNLCIKLLIFNIVFSIFPIIMYDLSSIEMTIYFVVLVMASLWCLVYCYRMLFIKYQKNGVCRKTINRLLKKDFYQLEGSPVYSTYKSDGFGFLARELYFTCKEEQRKLFEEKGYVIIVGAKDELRIFAKQRFINGYFSRADKYILLFTDCETSETKPYNIKPVTITGFKSTFWHEWGHFVDFSNNFISETRQFIKVFKDRKCSFKYSVRFLCGGLPSLYFRKNPKVNLYELSSPSEFFACKYSDYKMKRPISEYLKSIFDELEGDYNVTCSEKGQM